MEDVIAAKLETTGWVMVFRAGRKLGNTYVLISAYVLEDKLRITVRDPGLWEVATSLGVDH
jgi:hypothetical protein